MNLRNDISQNIFNAFDIVSKTYKNVEKLINYCTLLANQKDKYSLMSPKFLRYKSDANYKGWSINSFILIFQRNEKDEFENGWRNGPLYIMEINLYDPEYYDKPMVVLAKFDYNDMISWSEGVSPASHYAIYDPMYYNLGLFESSEKKVPYTGKIINTDLADKTYWGLRSISATSVHLTEITSENMYETIFGNFDNLE